MLPSKRACKHSDINVYTEVGDTDDDSNEENDIELNYFDDVNLNTIDLPVQNGVQVDIDLPPGVLEFPDDDILDYANVVPVNFNSDDDDDSSYDEPAEPDQVQQQQKYRSASGIQWGDVTDAQPVAGRQPQRNIIRFHEGPTAGVNPENERGALLMYLEETLSVTLHYTNVQGRRVVHAWNIKNPTKQKVFKQIDIVELEAFVGLLIILGKSRSTNKLNLDKNDEFYLYYNL